MGRNVTSLITEVINGASDLINEFEIMDEVADTPPVDLRWCEKVLFIIQRKLHCFQPKTNESISKHW